MFTNLCYVRLLLFADLPVLKFHFQLKKKKLGKSPGESRTWYNLADGVTALAQQAVLYTLAEHALSTNDIARNIQTL